MSAYETLFVVHPEKGSRMKEFVERFKKIIEAQGGSLSQVDDWGVRDLAYKIEKQGRGYYTLLRFEGTGPAVQELERNLKLTDGILRYLTVRYDEKAQAAAAQKPRGPASEPAQAVEKEIPKAENPA